VALHREDVYAERGSDAARRSRPAGRAMLAGTIALPMLLAVSLALLAWALPGNGESQALVALGLVGLAAAIGGSALWAVAASTRRRSRELQALRAERRALREELTAVAHDLRAPLVTANSYFELLAGEAFGRLPNEARRAAERGRVASERARSIADSTLQRALRSDRAGEPSVDLNALAGEVLAGLAVELAASDADIEVHDLPAVAGADRDVLYRVFANLIEHALQYAPPGRRPQIRVSGYEDGAFASISVRDWGPGIARREQERLLGAVDRTVGATPAEDCDASVAGIGLATVRRLVHEQGGRVWIDPLVTDGTLVRVALPLRSA
jgi:signal transduction histidine kinase